jgi:hypothetical protein
LDIATNFAFDEEAVGAIFHDTKGKEKQQENTNKGALATTPKRRRRLSRRARIPFWLSLSTRIPGPHAREAWEFLTRCSISHACTTRA